MNAAHSSQITAQPSNFTIQNQLPILHGHLNTGSFNNIIRNKPAGSRRFEIALDKALHSA